MTVVTLRIAGGWIDDEDFEISRCLDLPDLEGSSLTLHSSLIHSFFLFHTLAECIEVAGDGVLIIGSTCHYLLAKHYRA